MTYRKKLFLNFFAIFSVFTVIVIAIQYNRERDYKIDSLRSNLGAYTTIIHNYIETERVGSQSIDTLSYSSIIKILPSDLRITIISDKGVVFYDNISSTASKENHLQRPEILTANVNKTGYMIRESATTGDKYYYLATAFNGYFVRLALPYGMNLQALLQGNNLYIYFILALFICAFLSLLLLSDRMGRSISALRDFAYSIVNGKMDAAVKFPDGELGEIGAKLVESYCQIEKSKEELKREKDKLILHFSHSTVGIAFFSAARKGIYSNTLFITYLNALTDLTTLSIDDFFISPEFEKCVEFIDNAETNNKPMVYECKMSKSSQYYTIRVLVFGDKSIEVIIDNVTATEKNRILKQEMTSNIAHELRTPVSSISGYMETLINQKDISVEKSRFFIERTYSQVQRLADLIRDISIITRIEEGATEIEKDKIDLCATVHEVEVELKAKIERSDAKVINNIPKDTFVRGNNILLYSVFRNLIDNAISYAGDKVVVTLDRYFEDDNFYYFSVWDNGKGVGEEHLPKIFDRFYRTCEGRTRQDGGSGLGLSIVKNAVLFHGGTITAKNRVGAGLEILLSIKK